MNNKGISPLIATILLIVFSVALGAVVVSYGESFVESEAEFVQGVPEVSANACDTVNLQLIRIGQTEQICIRQSGIDLSFDNGPETRIDGIQARVAGTQDITITPNILSSKLEPASSIRTMFSFAPVGQVLQVRLTPFILSDGKQTFCSDKAIVAEGLPSC